MKILIQNVRGINTKSKRRQSFQNTRKRTGQTYKGPYDIILYQEARLPNHKLNLLKNKWGQRGEEQRVFLSGTVDNALRGGTVTLINNQMEVKILDTKTVTGHAIINLITHKGKTWLIGNIYGNPQADDTQSMTRITNITQQILDILTNFHTDYIILAGDWNCVLRNDDRKPQTEQALTDLIN